MMLVLVGLVLATAVASAGAIFQELDAQLVHSKQLELAREVDVQAVHFHDRVDELVRDVRVLAGTPPIQGLIRATRAGGIDPRDGSSADMWRARLEVIFGEMLASKPDYLQARYIGVEDGGRELVRVHRDASGAVIAVPLASLQQKGAESYFVEAIQRPRGEVHLSPINLNREHGEIESPPTPVLRAALPIYGPDGRPFGVVVINHAVQNVLNALGSVSNPAHTYYVTNAKGAYLSHPDAARAFEFESGSGARVADDFPVVAPLFDGTSEKVAVVAKGGVLAARHIGFGPDALDRNLVVVALTRLDDVTAISRSVLKRAIVVVAVFVAAALLIGVWLASSATAPIVSLARSVAEHDVEARQFEPPTGLSSEAADLADALVAAFARIDRHTRELEVMNKELAQFAYVASHDLQEPVRTIRSLVALLVDHHGEGFDEDAKEALGFLAESSQRAEALIHGLLEYSRLGHDAEPTSVDLGTMLQEVQRDLETRIRETGARIHVGPLPALTVYATELRILFLNLLSNALKFRRPDAPPEVEIRAERRGATWQFSVEDNGIGIETAHRERVFLIFQRLHHRGVYEGTGIGLAHCSKIVSLHHGRIWIEDAAGPGARVCFTLRDLIPKEDARS